MGFNNIKKRVIKCLDEGLVSHEMRNNIDVKNLLATGQVTLNEVATIIKRARSTDYMTSPHHFDASIEVHVLKVTYSCQFWYIKWYFNEANSVFISIHM